MKSLLLSWYCNNGHACVAGCSQNCKFHQSSSMLTVWRCRHVRKAAVQLLSTAAHNKPGLILDHLPSVLPLLYQQTTLNPALVR